MIPYGRQEICRDDIRSVIRTLNSDWLTQGPNVQKFEDLVAEKVGSNFAIACNSATSALHLACKSLNLKKGDIVWTSPNSFVASANAAIYCDAKVDFVDIDPRTYNLSIEKLEQKLIYSKKKNCLPKIIIPVHFAGQSCDMKSIYKLSKKYKFKIIEDASHAIGGSYENQKVGSCKYSSITVFSFHPVKIITTAEGGIATTNNRKIAEKLIRDRSHGITRNKKSFQKVYKDEIWNYQQVDLGFNYRMNDIQAALGISQLQKLEKFINKRHQIATYYNSELSNLGIALPYQDAKTFSSYHLYPIRVSKKKGGINQRKLFDYLRGSKIGINLHYIPIYRHPYFMELGFKKGYCEEAENHFKEVISLPMYSGLRKKEQKFVIDSIKAIYKK